MYWQHIEKIYKCIRVNVYVILSYYDNPTMINNNKENLNNASEEAKKSSMRTRIKALRQKIAKAFSYPSNEEAWDSFSDETKKEMLESLKNKDDFNLYTINITEMWDFDSTMFMWDTTDFKKWIVQKDKIWKYIMINWTKCREYQPGISWFVYKDIRDRYYPDQRLKIWFCDKGVFQKYVNINDFGEIESIDLPQKIEKLLWGPFYAVDNQYPIEKWPLSKISRSDLFSPIKEKDITDNRKETHTYSDSWKYDNEWKSLTINWVEFKPFETWISGFIYQEITNPLDSSSSVLLAEYKDWKMVGEWVIINSNYKIYIANKDNLTKAKE